MSKPNKRQKVNNNNNNNNNNNTYNVVTGNDIEGKNDDYDEKDLPIQNNPMRREFDRRQKVLHANQYRKAYKELYQRVLAQEYNRWKKLNPNKHISASMMKQLEALAFNSIEYGKLNKQLQAINKQLGRSRSHILTHVPVYSNKNKSGIEYRRKSG